MNIPSAQSSRASLRTRVRMGDLSRNRRPDPDGALEAREPDELLEPTETHDAGNSIDAHSRATSLEDRARCAASA